MLRTNQALVAILALTLLVTGCNDDDDNNAFCLPASNNAAVINTVASDYTDANIELVDLDADTLQAAEGCFKTGQSDYSVSSYNSHFYRIGRNTIDTISKHSILAPNFTRYRYSTIDDGDSANSNPYDIIFASESKAYIIRYNSNRIWVVDPSAESEADFKLHEIDLSDYADADNLAEIAGGLIIGNRLFVFMERLEFWSPAAGNSYVAVINTDDDTEVDTRPVGSLDTLKGIRLQTANPQKMVYQAGAGLFVQSIGSWSGDYIGGIEKIDTADFSTSMIIDDNATTGRMSGLAIVSDTLGYVVSYAGWGNTSLYRFNPATGTMEDQPIDGFAGIDITNLSVDSNQRLWVSIADAGNPRIALLDTADDSLITIISTVYNPGKVVFASTE
ncbi:MAG TPA: hypothetical protein VIN71_11720 [Pseudomonadales bacterium]